MTEGFPDLDLLPRGACEGESAGGLKDKDNGGPQIEVTDGLSFLNLDATSTSISSIEIGIEVGPRFMVRHVCGQVLWRGIIGTNIKMRKGGVKEDLKSASEHMLQFENQIFHIRAHPSQATKNNGAGLRVYFTANNFHCELSPHQSRR